MAAKNARLKRRCAKKVKYDSLAAAMGHKKALQRKGSQVHAYCCPHCGAWHIGHAPKAVRQSIAARKATQP